MERSQKIIRYLFGSIDFPLFIIVITLSIIGIIFSYSAQLQIYEVKINPYNKYLKQIVYLLIGILVVWSISKLNYRKICEHIWIIYFFSILILLYTLFGGDIVNQSKRWVSLGFIKGQPSEFVKIIMIIFIAKYLEVKGDKINEFKNFIMLMIYCLLPITLILVQPDLGTALVFLPTLFAMLWFSGINKNYLLPFIIIAGLTVGFTMMNTFIKIEQIEKSNITIIFSQEYFFSILIFFATLSLVILIFNFRMNNYFLNQLAFYSFIIFIGLVCAFLTDNYLLKDYQKKRLIAFLNPFDYRLDFAYNIIQSQITIGSGGLWGKGIFNGTQSQLGYLPSSATDFIFSVIGEELGFIKTTGVLGIFFLFLLRLWQISKQVKDYLGGYIISGIMVLFTLQIFINIGMTISLLPITGLPLPFVSAGGSTLISNLLAIGIVFSIYSRRYVYKDIEEN